MDVHQKIKENLFFDNNTIIHAIGIYSVDNSYENEGERIIRVLWKERYYPKYLGDKILLD